MGLPGRIGRLVQCRLVHCKLSLVLKNWVLLGIMRHNIIYTVLNAKTGTCVIANPGLRQNPAGVVLLQNFLFP